MPENNARDVVRRMLTEDAESAEPFWFEYGFDEDIKAFVLENAAEWQADERPLIVDNCRLASEYRADRIHEAFPDVEIEIHEGFILAPYKGEDDDMQGHAWLVVNGSILDPIADQFDPYPYMDSSMSDNAGNVIRRLPTEGVLFEDATDEQYEAVAKKTYLNVSDLRRHVRGLDPTENLKYAKWILKMIKSGALQLGRVEHDEVRDILSEYDKRRGRDDDLEADVFKYKTCADLETAVERVTEREAEPSRRQARKQYSRGAGLLHEDDEYRLYEITAPEAAVAYGMGSKRRTTELSPGEESDAVFQSVTGTRADAEDYEAKREAFFSRIPYMRVGTHEGYAYTADKYLDEGALYILRKAGDDGVFRPYLQWQIMYDSHEPGDLQNAKGRDVDPESLDDPAYDLWLEYGGRGDDGYFDDDDDF